MTQHRGTLGAAGPVAAGPIFAGREGAAIRLRAGESVVTIWRVADPGDHRASLRQRGLHVQLVVVAVKIIDALRDNFTLEILPRPGANAVARVDGRFAISRLAAQIGSLSLATSTGLLRQLLTIPIRSLDPAKIGTFARPSARDKKCHIGCLWCLLLRLRRHRGGAGKQSGR
jgi:hypothetical protein